MMRALQDLAFSEYLLIFDLYDTLLYILHYQISHCNNYNKRPLGLRAPLSNNIWSMIQSPMKWNELSMTLI